MRPHYKLRNALPLALALGLGLFATTLVWQVPPAAASGSLDNQASDLVRLINGARSASGKSSLTIDLFLASKARDGAIPCPDNPAKTIAGRARDMAARGSMSHDLPNCDTGTMSSKTFVSTLQTAWKYGSVGEILLENGGYGNGAYLYSVTGSKRTWMTWTYSTTGHGMLGWKSSSSHWAIIMGGYSHVGCGGWSSGSAYFYDCLFTKGGPAPSGLKSPPTKSPFSNPLPATPTPKPTAKPQTADPGPQPGPAARPRARVRVLRPPPGRSIHLPRIHNSPEPWLRSRPTLRGPIRPAPSASLWVARRPADWPYRPFTWSRSWPPLRGRVPRCWASSTCCSSCGADAGLGPARIPVRQRPSRRSPTREPGTTKPPESRRGR